MGISATAAAEARPDQIENRRGLHAARGETMRVLKCDWVRLDRIRRHRDPELGRRENEQAEERIYPRALDGRVL